MESVVDPSNSNRSITCIFYSQRPHGIILTIHPLLCSPLSVMCLSLVRQVRQLSAWIYKDQWVARMENLVSGCNIACKHNQIQNHYVKSLYFNFRV